MPDGIQIQGPKHEGFAEVLSEEAQKSNYIDNSMDVARNC